MSATEPEAKEPTAAANAGNPRRIAFAGLALAALVAVAVGVTVVVEHRLHDHEGHDHEAHEERGRGAKEGTPGHAGEKHEDRVKLGPEALKNAELELLVAGPSRVEVTLTLPGELAVNAERLAHVTPRVGGTVREVKRQLGDSVKKGDILAILDSRDLSDMQREAAAAQEKLKLAEGNFKRQDALFRERVAAEKDYLAAKQAYAEAQIEARGASQKLAAAGGAGQRISGGGYALLAPLDGTILEKHISVGEVLKDDTQAFAIADLTTLWVNVTVYAKDLGSVKAGQRAWVRVEGIPEAATGAIEFLGQVVAEQNRSAKARIALENPGPAWRPGLFATAHVVVGEGDAAVAVSRDAIQTVEGKDVVFVEEAGVFEARPVKLGRRGAASSQGGLVDEVLAGVKPGEKYVGKNSFLLKAELGKSEAGHEH